MVMALVMKMTGSDRTASLWHTVEEEAADLFDPDTIHPRRVLVLPTGDGWLMVRRLTMGELEAIEWLRRQATRTPKGEAARLYGRLATTYLFQWSILHYEIKGLPPNDIPTLLHLLSPDLVAWIEKHLLMLNGLTPQRQKILSRCLNELRQIVWQLLREDAPATVPYWAARILNIYLHYKNGFLPNMAGLSANNPHLLKALAVIERTVDDYLAEQRRNVEWASPAVPLRSPAEKRAQAYRSAENLLKRVEEWVKSHQEG